MPECIALIVAAGSGSRTGGVTPKQYTKVAGKPMLRWAIERSLATGLFDHVVCVIGEGQRASYEGATQGLELAAPVQGGVTRRASVLNGLDALVSLKPAIVSIQDAARPLVDAADVRLLIERVHDGFDGAILALPVVDTLKRGDQVIAATVSRDGLWQAQTPQVFAFPQILAAHRKAAALPEAQREALTDDAAVGELAGLKIALVAGRPENFKVTTSTDFDRLDRMLRANVATETRVGTGFDVHAFGPGDHVMLGAVKIAHDQGLVGHSDADVALHALTDAILGAIGAGDIGQHFPPSDPQWRGAASARFLQHAGALLSERGGKLVNADLTVICERPKIGPYRDAMAASIADILGVKPARISVKATTTEKLGFTGRGEGIAVQAMVSVTLPGGTRHGPIRKRT
jgi:2-C-methyl-D-erythritol 4-phosphate cytidylyltransferase/2-C-methyl-D-erythritol 2,4-cyclodiphosphate synthase